MSNRLDDPEETPKRAAATLLACDAVANDLGVALSDVLVRYERLFRRAAGERHDAGEKFSTD